MKQKFLEIILDNKDGVFSAGDEVCGHVSVILTAEMKIRGVRLEILGEMKVGFWQHQQTGDTSTAVYYSSRETYIKSTEILWKPQMSECLSAGSHELKFQIRIPSDCPTSFESSKGKIRYRLKAVLDRPFKIDPTCEVIFTVVNPINLYDNLAVLQPVEKSNSKTLILSSGELSVNLKLPKIWFVAGEVVPLYIEVNNGTTRDVKRVVAKLVKTATYTGYFCKTYGSFTKDFKETVVEVKKTEVISAGKSRIDQNEVLIIPRVCPTIESCKHLQVTYAVVVEVCPTGPSFTLDVEIPLTIGTVPHQSILSADQPNLIREDKKESLENEKCASDSEKANKEGQEETSQPPGAVKVQNDSSKLSLNYPFFVSVK